MSAFMRKTRSMSTIAAAGVLAFGLAGCGASNEAKKDDSASTSTSASVQDETSSTTPAVSPGPNVSDSPDVHGPGTTTPGGNQSPAVLDGHRPRRGPGVNQPPTSRGGADVGSLRDIPESAKATLDPAPLTQEELQRGAELPGEYVSAMMSGDTAGACDLMVMAENGEYVRFDRPEVRDLCVTELERDVESLKDLTPQQLREVADPRHYRFQDHGDGTATYVVDGSRYELKLVRLNDGNLRMMSNEL